MPVKTKDDIRSEIFQKIGYATMCWTPKPTGVFNSTECEKTANEIMLLVDEYAEICIAAYNRNEALEITKD